MEEEFLTKKQRRDLKRQQKLAKKERTATSARKQKLGIAAAVAVALIAVGALLVWSGRHNDDEVTVTDTYEDPYQGKAEAAVVVQEYSDFQCPACAAAQTSVTTVMDKYSDQVKLVFQDFPLNSIHANAENSALAAQCAFAQDNFWPYHDLLYTRQSEWSSLSKPEAINIFKSFADQLGLDVGIFTSCLDNKDPAGSVDEDIREADKQNINSTPTFFVNGERLVGGKDLLTAVEEALSIVK
ncbi:MAG: thioredoxin domain-containing protein [Patescibacteria group bacterium]